MKRGLDILLALPLLVLSLPLMAIAAVCIRLTSRGPVIFSQIRVGRDKKPFRCHKLRTMFEGTRNAPTHEAPPGSITPVGAFLRRYKIDELPQLWNVLKGEMSLVGPRPCLPSQQGLVELREERGVYAISPGISGLAQIRKIDMADPVACANADAEYLTTATPWLDARILFRTIFPQ